MKNLAQNSKSKLHNYPEISIDLIPENAPIEAKTSKSSKASLKKKKEEADKPIYLRRV
jgi:hypothetical protein